MEKYQKYGINPLLISVAMGYDLEHVSPRPTVAMLPGRYPRLVYNHIKAINSDFPENVFRLTCQSCSKSGDYDLGTVVFPAPISKDKIVVEKFQALGYFRCKHCNVAGKWDMSSRVQTMFAGKMATAALSNATDAKIPNGVVFGQALIDNAFAPHWGSDAESYFLEKLALSPEDAYLWNRLGNTYYKGKRPELAAFAYEQSLIKDKGQVESHFSLGQILLECGELEKAAEHLRQAVAFSHQYMYMPALNLREIIVGALEILLSIYNQSGKKIDMLPKPNELEIAHFAKSQIAATAKVDFEINTNRRETLYPLAEVYLGDRRNELMPEERTIYKKNSKAAWPLEAKVNKQKPSKKNKGKKKK